MQDLNDLYYFAMVVEHGGFAAAERALGIPKSRLSRRISQLETDMGVRLLQRSTRRFAVTDVGMSVYRHAQTMLTEAQAAREVIADRLLIVVSTPRGGLRRSGSRPPWCSCWRHLPGGPPSPRARPAARVARPAGRRSPH